jgi:hypothetical protein
MVDPPDLISPPLPLSRGTWARLLPELKNEEEGLGERGLLRDGSGLGRRRTPKFKTRPPSDLVLRGSMEDLMGTVAQMSKEEFQEIIETIIEQKLVELFGAPDGGAVY